MKEQVNKEDLGMQEQKKKIFIVPQVVNYLRIFRPSWAV